MNRVTAQDVAQAAGVSLATVDRVLNNRKGVRSATIKRVYEAMDQLNFVRDQAASNLARRRSYAFSFIVPTGSNSFIRLIEKEIGIAQTAAAKDRIDLNVVAVPPFEPDPIVRALDALDPQSGDGVAIVATESPLVRDAIKRVRDRGVHVITLISDVPNSDREHYVGIDNVAAGRAAASLLGRFIAEDDGDIAVVAGSSVLRDHVERRLGFEQVMRSERPNLTVLPSIEGADNAEIVEAKLIRLLAENPGIRAVYSLGGGNRGVISAVRGAGRPLRTVVHELTEHTRAALMTGDLDAVLAQDPGHEVRSAIRVLKAKVDDTAIDPSQERIRIEIFVRDNLP